MFLWYVVEIVVTRYYSVLDYSSYITTVRSIHTMCFFTDEKPLLHDQDSNEWHSRYLPLGQHASRVRKVTGLLLYSRLSQCVRIDVPEQSRAQRKALLLHDHGRDGGQIILSSATVQANGQYRLQGWCGKSKSFYFWLGLVCAFFSIRNAVLFWTMQLTNG